MLDGNKQWKPIWKITRYANEKDAENGAEYALDKAKELFGVEQETIFSPNVLCKVGINEIWTLLCSSEGTLFDNANAHLAVGTGTDVEDETDTEATFTDIATAGMVTGFPTYGANQKATWKANFGGTVANQAWEEFGVLNASSGGKLMNRKTSPQGTKVSGQTWQLVLEITLS